jgi:hypothetical protein
MQLREAYIIEITGGLTVATVSAALRCGDRSSENECRTRSTVRRRFLQFNPSSSCGSFRILALPQKVRAEAEVWDVILPAVFPRLRGPLLWLS